MAEPRPHRRRSVARWLAYIGIVLLALFVAGIAALYSARPWIHARALEMLRSRFAGQAEISDFHVSFFPIPKITGSGIVVRFHGRTDLPPLIEIKEFSATANPLGLLTRHIETVRVKSLTIHFPPKQERGEEDKTQKRKPIPVSISELICDNAELDMMPGKPDRKS